MKMNHQYRVQRKFQFLKLPKAVHMSRNKLKLGYQRISVYLLKASVPQELVKPVPICQKESFPLPLTEGTYGYLWRLSAYQSACWPPGSLSPHSEVHFKVRRASLPPATPFPYNPATLAILSTCALLSLLSTIKNSSLVMECSL